MAEHVPTRWVGLGLVTVGVLTLVDLASGVTHDPGTANIAGTLALAPALTSVGATRRQTVWVGVVAVLMTVLLCWKDDVSAFPFGVRVAVVVLAGVVAAVVAGVRTAQIALLQDRREAARTLQAAMLTELPEPDHLHLACRYLPASSGDQVGGDWYDALVDADGATTLVVGDVTGHDIRAAASMGQVRAMLRAYAVEGDQTPAELLGRVEAAVLRLGLDVLATVVVLRIEQTPQDRERGVRTVRWSTAGHPPPLLLDADGSVRLLEGTDDLMLGVGFGPPRRDHTHVVTPGSTVLLYTDGLVERRDEDLDEGLAALVAGVRRHADAPLQDLLDALLGDLLGTGHVDDVVLLAVRAHPEDVPRPAEAGPGHARPGPVRDPLPG